MCFMCKIIYRNNLNLLKITFLLALQGHIKDKIQLNFVELCRQPGSLNIYLPHLMAS